MSRSRSGLTMIETLLALALLAALLAASGSWITLASRAGSQIVEPTRREAAANAVLDLIHDDLVSGDFDIEVARLGRNDRRHPPRVREEGEEALEIEGRAGVLHVYRLDRNTRRLERTHRAKTAIHTRTLLEDANEFTINIDDELRTLDVAMTLAVPEQETPLTLARRYRLP